MWPPIPSVQSGYSIDTGMLNNINDQITDYCKLSSTPKQLPRVSGYSLLKKESPCSGMENRGLFSNSAN